MKKWMIASIACILLLQACDSANSNDEEKGAKEMESMNVSLDEQLLRAAEQGKTDTVSQLIKDGANIDTQDSSGRTPIMIATYQNDLETAKVLIEAGADVNIRDDMKNNPFLYAGAEGYLDILKLTIAAGADPSITNRFGGTALIPASEHGYTEVVKELLTNTNIDVNHINNLGWTALMEAIILSDGSKKQQETIQLLIKHGADVNIPDNNQVSPLQHARKMGFDEIEKILLEAGAE